MLSRDHQQVIEFGNAIRKEDDFVKDEGHLLLLRRVQGIRLYMPEAYLMNVLIDFTLRFYSSYSTAFNGPSKFWVH
jgi:hypothetical protein